MATVSRGLPEQPHLDIPKREARELLARWQKAERALDRVRRRHPKFKDAPGSAFVAANFKLSDAQLRARSLLERGAAKDARANLRKFLD